MDVVDLSETIDDILNHVRTNSSKSNVEELQKALEKIQPLVNSQHLRGGLQALPSLRNLKNAIYDVTDLLEELSTDYALPQKSKLSFIKTADPRLKAVNTKIMNVIEVLQMSADQLLRTTTNTPTPTPSQEAREEMQEIKLDLSVIGREKEKKEIIDQLMPPRANIGASDVVPNVAAPDIFPIPVVTIVGFSGIGKKELVRLICKDNVVQAHFGMPIRVPDVESFENCVANMSPRNQKSYLVVMEDLETEITSEYLEKWQVILTGGESAILITTSSKFVANNITAIIHNNNNIATSFTSFRPHVLQGLNEEDSWLLFGSIHGSSSICMGEIEHKILKDCGGVPLLIKFTSEFLNNRSGDTAANDAYSLKEEFLKKLKLEYYDKLTRLHKMCFSFCSLFPRDHLIDVKRLNHLLNAEGFLMDVKSTTVEENLSQYFNDFLQKPFFKDIEKDKCGVVRKCRMQPLMHDLACLVSDQEENIKVDPEGGKVHEGVLRASFYYSLNISRGIPSSLFEKAKKLRVILLMKTQRLLPDEGCLALTHMPSKVQNMGNSLQTLTLFVASNKDVSGGLCNLKSLNNLRGHLEISHLERISLDISNTDYYLNKKKHLQHLTLRWDHDDDEKWIDNYNNSVQDRVTLEFLEPHDNLRAIFLVGYKGKKLSTWFSSVHCLVKLSLYDCTNCKYFEQLNRLPKLKFLELLKLDNLKFIINGDIDKQDAMFFPSLKELIISDCPNLKGWWKKTKIDDNLPAFSCLSKLHVYYCPKLICMPLFPDLDEELVLVGSRVDPLVHTILYTTRRYSKLKSMKIASIEEGKLLPEMWIKYFISLEKLDIKEWKHLQSIPEGFHHLTSLHSLNIENCQELDLDHSDEIWEHLKNLRSLTIRENPKLKSLPSGVIKLTSLQNLQLHNCSEMTCLPETIYNLQSLGRLVIYECNKLASLPKALKKMKSLHTLIILDCTLLLPRCQPDTGDDWPQIAHIENKKVTKTHRGL
ncbi:hypothetical protein TSUD_222520 [Trifolium subterraneum]|uniref:Uncharacterized protein n=1 Tax=Trifolium subterraneum TaxID=3900 RepID=A0A2Z6M028_TRISU|nr:hypothetical protein TSUD_222520 [Trifolium subterraneum]